ncbi:hypothetical protein ACHAQD_008797 [Fusarium lateritium]
MNDSDDLKIFLPILLESPSRGSAWEQSTPIRQLAYTIARWIVPGSSSTIQEYRRVNTTVQKGRQVLMLPERAAKARAQDLVRLMSMAKAGSHGDAAQAWHTLCLTLDIRYCREEGKHSHTLQTLEESLQSPAFKKVTWDIVHFVAHLQAAYYSFRLLKQIMSIAQTKTMLPELQDMLSSLPLLAEFPDVDKTLTFLQKSGQADVYRTISKLVPLPDTNVVTKPKRTAKDKKRKVSKENAPKSKPRIPKPATRNFFDVLSHQG